MPLQQKRRIRIIQIQSHPELHPEPHPSLAHDVPLLPHKSKSIIIQIHEQLLPLPPNPKGLPQPHDVADKSLIFKPPIKFLWFILFKKCECVKIIKLFFGGLL